MTRGQLTFVASLHEAETKHHSIILMKTTSQTIAEKPEKVLCDPIMMVREKGSHPIKELFYNHFDEAYLSSEQLRIKILLAFFIFCVAYSVFNYVTLPVQASSELRSGMTISMIFLAAMMFFELGSLLMVKKNIKRGNRMVPLCTQYLMATVEISSPVAVMAILAQAVSTPNVVLHSPAAYLNFIIIILSTLRLNFRITAFTAVLSAVEFLVLGLRIGPVYALDMAELQNSYVSLAARTFAILVSGVGAAFVARQIQIEINKSFATAERNSRIVNLFGQQVSKEIVDEMLNANGSIPSKVMRVCVMFVDIRNFTAHIAGMTPCEIVACQNAFFSVVIEVVTRNQGVINQFLGDGCMITFGAPVPTQEACRRAVNASLEIKSQLTLLSGKGGMLPTDIGIGIHVGEVVTGNIGTDVRQQYSVTGSPVILAARLEQLNKTFQSQILVSREVMEEALEYRPDSTSLGEVNLKGWSQPVHVFKLA